MTMGEKILKLRKARQWSQEELAERIGVTRQAVSRWEAGAAKPDADKIIAVCDLFGVSADYLLRESYSGEKVCTAAETASEMRPPAREGMTAGQILGIIMIVMGVTLIFVLAIVSALNPHTHYVWTADGEYAYTGIVGFITGHNLQWLIYADVIVIVCGLYMLFWKNYYERYCRRKKSQNESACS